MNILIGQRAPAAEPGANAAVVAADIAAHPAADLAVFPELFLTGYDLDRVAARALPADASELREIAGACASAGTAAVVGFAERLGDGAVANAVACFDRDGSRAGVYRKLQLFGPDETSAFRAGDRLLRTELAGVRVGTLICFDVEFPELGRALAQAGVDLLVTASANMDPYGPDHDLAVRARALENRLPHVYANRVGEEAGLAFAGESKLVDAGGRVVAGLARDASCLLADLEVPARRSAGEVDYLRHLPEPLTVEDVRRTPENLSSGAG